MKHAVTWFEIMGNNLGSLKTFYSDLFSWEFEDLKDMNNYTLVKSDGQSSRGEKAIPGGIGQLPPEVPKGYTTIYVEVDNLGQMIQKVKDLGGKILLDEMAIQCGKVALFEDPQGNTIGLAQMEPV